MIRHHDTPNIHPICGPLAALVVAVAATVFAPSLTPDGLIPLHGQPAYAAPAVQDGSSVIEGFVFLDADDDGLLGAAEQGLSGLTVILEPEDGDEQTQRTDASGSYRFTGLEGGAYTVRLGDAPNFEATGPSVYRDLELVEDGETLSGVDFGVVERADAATEDDEDEADADADDDAEQDAAEEETAGDAEGTDDADATATDDDEADTDDGEDAAEGDDAADADAAGAETDDDDGAADDDAADDEAAGIVAVDSETDTATDTETADDEAAVMQMLREDLEEMAASGEMPAGTDPAVAAAMAQLEPAEAAAIADAVANNDMAALDDAIAMLDDDEAEQLADAVEEAGAPDMADRVRTARTMASEERARVQDQDEDAEQDAAEAPSPDMPQTGFGDLGGMALLVGIAILMGLVGGYGLLRERNGGAA